MAILDPSNLTVRDLCAEALREAGVVGEGQTTDAGKLQTAQFRLQSMLQGWERHRWMVYHLVTLGITSTGATSYTVGPGGDIDTGVGSVRPQKLESAFFRQLINSQPNAIDYPLIVLQSMEDYNRIALKTLKTFPGACFLDPAWPLGNLYLWPVPQEALYKVFITVREQLPSSFATQTTAFNLPYEYYEAMLYNLALRLRSRFQLGTYNGDMLPKLAADSMKTVKGSNVAIARLQCPDMGSRPKYNIFNDGHY